MSVLVIILASLSCASASLPSYIKPCARDSNFNACALEHAKQSLPSVVKGDRKLQIPVLDPLVILELKQENVPGNSISVNLKDINVIGFKDADIKKTGIDFEKNFLTLEFTLPVLKVLGKYEASGRLLFLPITGNGEVNSTSVDSTITFSADIKYVERHGKQYVQLENPRTKLVPKRVYITLTNLFNGNEQLGKEMNAFIDKNWKEVNDELSPPVTQGISEVVLSSLNKLLLTATKDELFAEKL